MKIYHYEAVTFEHCTDLNEKYYYENFLDIGFTLATSYDKAVANIMKSFTSKNGSNNVESLKIEEVTEEGGEDFSISLDWYKEIIKEDFKKMKKFEKKKEKKNG